MQDESSCTTPSAFGNPPYPTLSSSGSSSTILTPAITASSTSAPWDIIVKDFWTAVMSPPFLKRFPLAEEMTIGLTPLRTRMLGNRLTDDFAVARVSPATALRRMKSRRLIFLLMEFLEESLEISQSAPGNWNGSSAAIQA